MFKSEKQKEAERKKKEKLKQKQEATKESIGIMKEEMGKHGLNIFKGYAEGRKKVMEKHGDLIIEHTAE